LTARVPSLFQSDAGGQGTGQKKTERAVGCLIPNRPGGLAWDWVVLDARAPMVCGFARGPRTTQGLARVGPTVQIRGHRQPKTDIQQGPKRAGLPRGAGKFPRLCSSMGMAGEVHSARGHPPTGGGPITGAGQAPALALLPVSRTGLPTKTGKNVTQALPSKNGFLFSLRQGSQA